MSSPTDEKIYDSPTGWYCYTAIVFAGDRILLDDGRLEDIDGDLV